MENKTFTNQDIVEENNKIELNKVKFQREWSFWENYADQTKNGDRLNWEQCIAEIFQFDNLIAFWQFWNNYHGAEASNIFYNGERFR